MTVSIFWLSQLEIDYNSAKAVQTHRQCYARPQGQGSQKETASWTYHGVIFWAHPVRWPPSRQLARPVRLLA
jgi:hypothetical protein